jgi:hypothetical protein
MGEAWIKGLGNDLAWVDGGRCACMSAEIVKVDVWLVTRLVPGLLCCMLLGLRRASCGNPCVTSKCSSE